MLPRGAVRRELPQVRNSKIFKFTVAGIRGYVIVGEYDDGTPGELFISIAKMGSTLRGVMDAFAVSVSYGLQFGVPLKTIRPQLHQHQLRAGRRYRRRRKSGPPAPSSTTFSEDWARLI